MKLTAPSHDERRRALEEFLSESTDTSIRNNLSWRSLSGREAPRETMQHNLARNLLVMFFLLFLVSLCAVFMFNARFCPDPSNCGENFVNVKSVIDTLLDFGSPFLGIIIGFFFSEKFGRRNNDGE